MTVRVLLVEDNSADARLLYEYVSELPDKPFSLTHAATLAEARKHVANADVVLLDLSLPDGHGLATLEKMNAMARHLPVVVLTGNDDASAALEALKAGAQDYLTKAEISPALIAKTVRYALERKRAEVAEVERTKAEVASERARFIAQAVSEVTRSTDLEKALSRLCDVLAPRLGGQVCAGLVDGSGEPEPGGHDDPALREVMALAVSSRATQLQSSRFATPLRAGGRVIGAIGCHTGPQPPGEEQVLLAEEIAAHVALAIDNVRLAETARRAVAARDELIAVVSHDLRNPLNVVSLSLGLLTDDDESRRVTNVVRAQRALSRMQSLLNDLLDVTRVESGSLSLSWRPFELTELLEETLEIHRPLAANRKIRLEGEFAGAGAVSADRDRIAQVLGNLIGNALKYTPAGGAVRLAARREDEGAVISVADTGVGIAPENLARVFDRFWQKERRSDGVGLGLAIAKGIVDAHHSELTVESQPGQGATFSFRLPWASTELRPKHAPKRGSASPLEPEESGLQPHA